MPEQESPPLTAGKMLMQWKESELGPSGQAQERYIRQIREVKQGVNEAILREQVPRGYHETIKQYFDSLEESAVGTQAE